MSLLTKHNLNLAKLASKDESRFTLAGILVQPESTVVTDGHILVEVGTSALKAESYPELPGLPPATDTWAPFVLMAPDAAAVAKNLPYKSTMPILRCAAVLQGTESDNGAHTTIATTDLDRVQPITVKRNGHNFPDYKRVMKLAPQPGEEDFSINFNAANLAAVFDWIAGTNGSKRGNTQPPVCTLRFSSNRDAIRVDAKTDNGEPITALLMPARTERLVNSTSGVIYDVEHTRYAQNTVQHDIVLLAATERLSKLREQVAQLEKILGETK